MGDPVRTPSEPPVLEEGSKKEDLTELRFKLVVHMMNLDPKLRGRLEVYFK